MQIPLLQEIVIILGLSAIVIYIFQRMKLPTILGLLLTGVLIGPGSLGLIRGDEAHKIEMLAEIGVILLLFIIGLEFSLKTLASIQRIIFIGGGVQVGLTILTTYLAATFFGFSGGEAVMLGFLFSLSSTAIVLKLLQEKNEMSSPHGKIVLAILIFQDIIVVPMMLFTPIIAGKGGDVGQALLSLVLKAVFVISLVIFGARYVVPRLLHEIASVKSRELFILSIIVICFAVAWGTSQLGLSLALGAFMAGLIISESEYSYQATGIIIPLREIFTSFFFVSIGMLLDVSFFLQNIWIILGLTLLVMFAKALIASIAVILLRYPFRTVLMTGLSLFQVGEFAFILSVTGINNGLLSEDTYQYFLSASILSMVATPFVIQNSDKIFQLFIHSNIRKRLNKIQSTKNKPTIEDSELEHLKRHVIIIGYGLTGQNVARAAREAHIPYVIAEVNPQIIKKARAEGEPIYYGDAISPFILEHLKVYNARVAVVAMYDPAATKAIITNIRSICDTVYIIVRTRAMSEMDEFYNLGANEVITEEFETSIEIFTRVLQRYLVPHDEIEGFIQRIREEKYQMLRSFSHREDNRQLLQIPNMNVTCIKVQRQDDELVGKPIRDTNLRSDLGINLIAIQRQREYITDIQSDTQIEKHDLLYVVGTPEAIAGLNKRLKKHAVR